MIPLRTSTLAILMLTSCSHQSQDRVTTPRLDQPESNRLEYRILDEELARLEMEPHVRMALGVVLDPRNGQVLAMQSRADGGCDPELPEREPRSHGSIAKVFSIATAIEFDVVTLDEMFSADGGRYEYGGLVVQDMSPHDAMTVGDVLAFSSNVGTIQIFERLGRDRLFDGLSRFRLAHRVPEDARTSDAAAASLAYGGLSATPIEVAVAFAAIANGGVLHPPGHHSEARTASERALSPETAETMMRLLEGAVARDDATGRLAGMPGHRVAGKTGTVSIDENTKYGSFVGAIPADAPRYVILIGVLVEGAGYHGGTIAAPSFARVAARLLGQHDEFPARSN